MTKDYAYSPPKTTVMTHLFIWLGISALFISMLFICFKLYHLHHHQPNSPSKNKTKPAATTMAAKLPSLDENAQTNFDFYSMLTKPAQPTPPAKQPSIKPNQYFLQVAVTSSQSGATQLIVKLGTEGYAAIIKNDVNQSVKRYTVLIGPYFNSKKAAQDQNQLKALGTNSLIVNTNNLLQ